MFRFIIVTLVLIGCSVNLSSQTYVTETAGPETKAEREERRINYLLSEINALRTKGCKCGRKRMAKVAPLTWNDKLEYSAYLHAKEMNDYNYFGHRSRSGEDVGDRVDKIGYKWRNVGENLAVGQTNFKEALKDWLESDSHCRMIMDPKMSEMGLAKVGRYWVHHFGTLMPPKTKRVSTIYREG